MTRGLSETEIAEYEELGRLLEIAKREVKRLSSERHRYVMRGRSRRIGRIAHLLGPDDDQERISRLAEYATWSSMRARCHNPKNDGYADYGGRGIQVCVRWRDSFENFLMDMGRRPEGMTIERENNDGNYEPGNCRWATIQEQARNKRPPRPPGQGSRSKCKHRSQPLFCGGRTISQIAADVGVSRSAIRKRIATGWPLDRLDDPGRKAKSNAARAAQIAKPIAQA